MRFSIFIVAQCALIACSTVYCDFEQKIRFANAFIANESPPLQLFVRAPCWTRSDMVQFSRDSRKPVQFIDSSVPNSDIPFKPFSNLILFFVDMTCSGSTQFLLQVCPLQMQFLLSLRHVHKNCLLFCLIRWPQNSLIRWMNHILRSRTTGFCSTYRWMITRIIHCWMYWVCRSTVMSPSFIITTHQMTIVYNKVRAHFNIVPVACHFMWFFVRSLQDLLGKRSDHVWTVRHMEHRNWTVRPAINANSLAATSRLDGPTNIGIDGSNR